MPNLYKPNSNTKKSLQNKLGDMHARQTRSSEVASTAGGRYSFAPPFVRSSEGSKAVDGSLVNATAASGSTRTRNNSVAQVGGPALWIKNEPVPSFNFAVDDGALFTLASLPAPSFAHSHGSSLTMCDAYSPATSFPAALPPPHNVAYPTTTWAQHHPPHAGGPSALSDIPDPNQYQYHVTNAGQVTQNLAYMVTLNTAHDDWTYPRHPHQAHYAGPLNAHRNGMARGTMMVPPADHMGTQYKLEDQDDQAFVPGYTNYNFPVPPGGVANADHVGGTAPIVAEAVSGVAPWQVQHGGMPPAHDPFPRQDTPYERKATPAPPSHGQRGAAPPARKMRFVPAAQLGLGAIVGPMQPPPWHRRADGSRPAPAQSDHPAPAPAVPQAPVVTKSVAAAVPDGVGNKGEKIVAKPASKPKRRARGKAQPPPEPQPVALPPLQFIYEPGSHPEPAPAAGDSAPETQKGPASEPTKFYAYFPGADPSAGSRVLLTDPAAETLKNGTKSGLPTRPRTARAPAKVKGKQREKAVKDEEGVPQPEVKRDYSEENRAKLAKALWENYDKGTNKYRTHASRSCDGCRARKGKGASGGCALKEGIVRPGNYEKLESIEYPCICCKKFEVECTWLEAQQPRGNGSGKRKAKIAAALKRELDEAKCADAVTTNAAVPAGPSMEPVATIKRKIEAVEEPVVEEDAGLKTPPKKARVTIPLSASTIPAPFGVPYAQDSAGATLNGTPQDADEKIAVKAELIDWATATLAALQPAVAKPDLSRPSSTKVETEADAFRAWTTLEDDPDDDELAASLDVKDNVF